MKDRIDTGKDRDSHGSQVRTKVGSSSYHTWQHRCVSEIRKVCRSEALLGLEHRRDDQTVGKEEACVTSSAGHIAQYATWVTI